MKAAFFTIILLFSLGAKAQVRPWPLDNGPSGAPPQPTPAEIAAQQQALKAQQDAYNEQLRQQQELGRQNDRSEMANPMMGMPGMNPQSASTNGIERAGSGPDLSGMSSTYINGCSTEPGKVQFRFGEVQCATPDSCSKKPAGCDARLQMDDRMAVFLENNLNRCVQAGVTAATGNSSVGATRVFHAGFQGDARHQMTGSLHNAGLAFDMKAVEVNGRTYVYDQNMNSESRKFFEALRNCWGDAVSKERAGCLAARRSGAPQGTIGHEDHSHNHHMHLSLPECTETARARGLYIACVETLFSIAHAETKPRPYNKSNPPATFTRKSVKVKNGELKLTVEDSHGEPLMADHHITLEVLCKNKQSKAPLPIKIEACGYTDLRYDAKKNEVTILYTTSDLVDGLSSCRLAQKETYQLPCQ